MTKQKAFRVVVVILIILGIVAFLPLPIPRIQTMTGTCLRHGETVEVKLYALELRYLFRDPKLYLLGHPAFWGFGNGFRMKVDGIEERFALPGGDGPVLRDFPTALEDSSQSAPGEFRNFSVYRFFSVGQSVELIQERYDVVTDAGFDHWVMKQRLYPEADGEPHLFALSKDGDTEAVCREMSAVIDRLEG